MWYIISRIGIDTKAFYPIYAISKHMNAKYINYLGAKDINFKGANVILHCVWKKNQYDAWKTLPTKLKKEAKNLWVEFDADDHMDKLYRLDKPKNNSRFFQKIFEPVDKFIWEEPMFYNPFARPVERIQLRCYHQEFEKPISAIKDINFFTCLDSERNLAETIELFTELHRRKYSVCFMILRNDLYEFYKNKLEFPIITNSSKFTANSIQRFNHLMQRSKVYVDLSYRLTTGRVVYDAAFYGAYFVGSNTYGATDVLFPEYSITTYPVDLSLALDKSIEALSNWDKEKIVKKRNQLRTHANVELFIKELEERSK